MGIRSKKQDSKSINLIAGWQQFSPLLSFESRIRIWPFRILTGCMFVLLLGRLAQLTMVEGSYYRSQADDNRVLSVRLAAERGVFTDRNGERLVINEPLFKRQVPNTSLAQGMFEPISREKALAYVAEGSERIYFDVHRRYTCFEACANIIGYMGEISEKELEGHEDEYMMGDLLGKAGLEKTLEKQLRGMPGQELVEVDAQGRLVRQIGRKPWQAGANVALTLDLNLQQFAYGLFKDVELTGAMVVQEANSGEVLALVSYPSYDPNNIAQALEQPGQPFFNRALYGVYPPGSVFKIIPAVAGLEEGVINRTTAFEDTGSLSIDTYSFGTWYYLEHGRVEGQVDVVKGLQRSNDIFFYKVGEELGPNAIAEWARLFGMGESIDLSGIPTATGTIPDPAWKETTLGERWYLGNTYHMAIGQGDVLVTPLQINEMMSAIANDGVLCLPTLVKSQSSNQSCRQLNLKPSTLEIVREGLKLACQPGGTGVPFFHANYQVACKTGTAQQGGEKDDPHAWFTVYAPLQQPKIVVTTLVEKGGQGSEVAAPLSKAVVDWWMEHRGEI